MLRDGGRRRTWTGWLTLEVVGQEATSETSIVPGHRNAKINKGLSKATKTV